MAIPTIAVTVPTIARGLIRSLNTKYPIGISQIAVECDKVVATPTGIF